MLRVIHVNYKGYPIEPDKLNKSAPPMNQRSFQEFSFLAILATLVALHFTLGQFVGRSFKLA